MSNPWQELNLSVEALELIEKAGYGSPTPVQAQCIPVALEGKDLIGTAQTGTGKTATFTLPMIERFAGRKGTFGLVLAPTREIAQQTQATFEKFGTPRGVTSVVLIGGVNMRDDDKALATYPQVIVATPGRLCDHLDRGNIWLDFIEMVVLDEADRMLDMGFTDQLSRIMQDVPATRQTLLFSATMTPSVEKLARKIMKDPARVAIGAPATTAANVEQFIKHIPEERKNTELRRIIREETGSIIVFTRSKIGATKVWRSLHSSGVYDATYIHSDRLQSHREQALAEFKEGKYRILIATDVAGRGIHVEGVAHVVNYDLPMEPEDYVHRIGRTGRAGATGRATTFVTPRDKGLLKEIEKLIGRSLSDAPESAARPESVHLAQPTHASEPVESVEHASDPLESGGVGVSAPSATLQADGTPIVKFQIIKPPGSSEPVVAESQESVSGEEAEPAGEALPAPKRRGRDRDRDRDEGDALSSEHSRNKQKTFFPIDEPPPAPLSARGLYSGTSTPWSVKSASPWPGLGQDDSNGDSQELAVTLGVRQKRSHPRSRNRRGGRTHRAPEPGSSSPTT